MPDCIRSFIAVEIDDTARTKLAAMQDMLKKAGGHVSWVAPRNIHCTLLFLGDLFPAAADSAANALTRATAGIKSFAVEIAGLGFFGSARSPRIIWTGMTGATGALVELQGKIADAVLQAGLKPDLKPFKPHLTIGRVRSNRNAAALVAAIEAGKDTSFGKLVVQRVVLMKSTLGSQGPEYSVLQAMALGTA